VQRSRGEREKIKLVIAKSRGAEGLGSNGENLKG
jgi:hypothetical protein